MVSTLTINGQPYTLDELEQITGADNLQPPLTPEQIAALTARLNEINRESSPIAELLAAAVLLALIPRRSSGVVYLQSEGRYYRGTKRLRDAEIQRAIAGHQARSRALADRWTDQLLRDEISLRQWGGRMGDRIVSDHLRMAQIGAGSRRGLTNGHMADLHRRLMTGIDGPSPISELDALSRFMGAMGRGELSESAIRARARQYMENTRASYEEARHRSLANGGWLAMRSLDPGANHCPDCPGLTTGGQFIPAADVVPVGSQCRCRGRCRCQIVYRRLSDPLPIP